MHVSHPAEAGLSQDRSSSSCAASCHCIAVACRGFPCQRWYTPCCCSEQEVAGNADCSNSIRCRYIKPVVHCSHWRIGNGQRRKAFRIALGRRVCSSPPHLSHPRRITAVEAHPARSLEHPYGRLYISSPSSKDDVLCIARGS